MEFCIIKLEHFLFGLSIVNHSDRGSAFLHEFVNLLEYLTSCRLVNRKLATIVAALG